VDIEFTDATITVSLRQQVVLSERLHHWGNFNTSPVGIDLAATAFPAPLVVLLEVSRIMTLSAFLKYLASFL